MTVVDLEDEVEPEWKYGTPNIAHFDAADYKTLTLQELEFIYEYSMDNPHLMKAILVSSSDSIILAH